MRQINEELYSSLPIAQTVFEILWEGKDPLVAFEKLESALF
jgi:DNA-binding Xre family transcriptional regulator